MSVGISKFGEHVFNHGLAITVGRRFQYGGYELTFESHSARDANVCDCVPNIVMKVEHVLFEQSP